jgi:hypothetical protein
MGVSTVLTALAGLGVLAAAVAIGIMMVLGGRSHEDNGSDRVRRFFNDRRRDAAESDRDEKRRGR